MAEENKEKVIIEFDTNADQAKKSVDGLNASVNVTIEENQKLVKSNTQVSETQDKVSKSTQQQKVGFEDLGNGVGGAITQVKGFSKQLLLLLANPIVLFLTAIVGTLALLFKAFTSTNDGADKMEQIMSGLSAVIDILRDRFLKIVDVAKKLFSGDVIGAAKEYLSIFQGMGDEIAEEFNKAADAAKRLQEVEDATREMGVARAKLNRDLAASKELLTDETASYADKKKAIEAVRIAEEKQTAQELENAKKKLKSIQDLNALSDTSDEDLQKEADARTALYNLEQKSAEDKRAIRKTEIRADKEEQSRLKEIADERKARDKERADREKADQKVREEARKKELDDIRTFNKAVADADTEDFLTRQQKKDDLFQEGLDKLIKDSDTELAVRKQIGDREKAYEKELADAKLAQKQSEKESLEALGNSALTAAKDLFGKNKAIQKGVIVAEGGVALGKLAVNTIEAVGKDNAASPLTFGMPWSGIHIATGALGAASIIANTSKALQAVGGGGSIGASPTLPTAPRGASAQPQVGFQASSENQIGTSFANAQASQPPIETYVVGSKVTTQQGLDSKLVSENSFGG